MAREETELTNFTAGELSPRLKGRTDISKYFNGCDTLLNFVVMPQGGATLRPGTMYVASNESQTNPARLIPFTFSTAQAYMLEFYANGFRVLANDGVVLNGSSPVLVTTPYGAGDLAALGYCQSADVLYLTSPSYPTQQVTRSSNTSWAIGAVTFRDGPYLDVNGTATTLSVSGTTGNITITASAVTGINGGSGFLSTDVGRFIRIKLASLWAWCIITAVTSTTVVSATVQPAVPNGAAGALDGTAWAASTAYSILGTIVKNGGNYYQLTTVGTSASSGGPSGTGTTIDDGSCVWEYLATAPGTSTTSWQLGKWSATTGYPYLPMFWQNRLLLCGTNNEPNAVEGSVTGDFTNFAPSQADGTVADINAFSWIISDDQVNAVRWLSPVGSAQAMQIGIGTSGGEEILQAATTSQALTPSSVQAYRETALGSAPNLRPLRIGKSLLFFNRPGRKLHEWTFQWQVNGYVGPDLAVLAEHITVSGVTQIAYQQSPHSVVWGIRADGQLIGLTYLREQDVVAWHRHQLGGQYYGGAPIVESLACIPSPDGSYDELWLSVLRTINGTPTRFIEVLTRYFDHLLPQDSWFLDAAVGSGLFYPPYTGTPSGFTAGTAADGTPIFTGTGTVAASGSYFVTGHVGAYIRINSGILLVTAYTDSEHVQAQVILPMKSQAPATSGNWTCTAVVISFSGATHLDGETVSVSGDGSAYGAFSNWAGSVSLTPPPTQAVIGLAYQGILVDMPAASTRMQLQGKTKRIDTVLLRFFETIGGTVGSRETDPWTNQITDRTEPLITRQAADTMGESVPLNSGIRRVKPLGGSDREGQIIVKQTDPLPMTLLSIVGRLDAAEVLPR